jgi:hypothetical protein
MTLRRLIGLSVASACAVLPTTACQPMASPAAAANSSQRVERLVARCMDAMLRDVCVAQRDEVAQRSTPAASQVFVAGTGAIDARAYAEIRASGDAMCSLVKTRCTADWNAGACKTARSLWPAHDKS